MRAEKAAVEENAHSGVPTENNHDLKKKKKIIINKP